MIDDDYKINKPSSQDEIILKYKNAKSAKISFDKDDKYWPFCIRLTDGYHSYTVHFKESSAVGLKKWLNSLDLKGE